MQAIGVAPFKRNTLRGTIYGAMSNDKTLERLITLITGLMNIRLGNGKYTRMSFLH